MKEEFILGKKIYLRPIDSGDVNLFCDCINSLDIRYTFFTSFPTNRSRQEELLKNLYKEKDYIPFAICIKETNEAVGVTAFHRVDYVSRAAIFSIIIVDSKDWGQGYGSEATKLMVDYGFEILNLNRIQLHVFAGNERGIKAYEKAGFVKEGLLREAMYHNNEYCDFYVMGILRRDYYKNKS